jgi:hypothetical protein
MELAQDKRFYTRVALPALLGIGVLAMLAALPRGDWLDALSALCVPLVMAFLMLLALGRYADGVDLDLEESALWVQFGRRQARIALAGVEGVDYRPGSRGVPPHVTVRLRRDGGFGREFAFLVPREFSLDEHSVVQELRAQVALACLRAEAAAAPAPEAVAR